ncbi:4a-hydroxytetrahydrobiopterin dehydratase [Spongiimicrobium salis]|uniref:4a-hydroxytetrahydrobiopterin dehydratase n=1 Tax=Spongiimicrobium salis TaxID=1667022 RepID=UPI00374D319E
MKKLNDHQIKEELQSLNGWEYNGEFIEKSFQFQTFKETFAIMTHIAFESELQGHHPDWSNVYNRLHIKLNTHDANGITSNDFLLARTIDAIVG